jgi:hypothetical protein
MLSSRQELTREIEELARAVRAGTRDGDGLVVFPEGEILNLLAERPNPIRHKLYLPGYLTDANEPAVLAELEAARPAAVVIWNRPVTEYDPLALRRRLRTEDSRLAPSELRRDRVPRVGRTPAHASALRARSAASSVSPPPRCLTLNP